MISILEMNHFRLIKCDTRSDAAVGGRWQVGRGMKQVVVRVCGEVRTDATPHAAVCGVPGLDQRAHSNGRGSGRIERWREPCLRRLHLVSACHPLNGRFTPASEVCCAAPQAQGSAVTSVQLTLPETPDWATLQQKLVQVNRM